MRRIGRVGEQHRQLVGQLIVDSDQVADGARAPLKGRSKLSLRLTGWKPLSDLKPVVRERLVGVGHTVRVFFLLDRWAGVIVGVHKLASEFLGHTLAASLSGIADHPSERQRSAADWPHFHRNLIVLPTNPPWPDFHRWNDIANRLVKHFQGLDFEFFRSGFEGSVNNPLGF